MAGRLLFFELIKKISLRTFRKIIPVYEGVKQNFSLHALYDFSNFLRLAGVST